MRNGFRQSMAWLHTWTGLLLGWLLFAVFLTGTIAYFRDEVNLWMQPELHAAQAPADGTAGAVRRGLDVAADLAPQADSWTLTLPHERSPAMVLSWPSHPPQPGQRGGERRILDPATGEVLEPRPTAGGNFLYRFHFELHGMPREWGRLIVGIATMAMFVAIISGVITHKKIFKEFFTFRPGKGQRSWLDLHNMTGVLALPFHVMITFSGLVLFTATLLPFSVENLRRQVIQAPSAPQVQPLAVPPAVALVDLAPMIAKAEAAFGAPVARVVVEARHSGQPVIALSAQPAPSLVTASGNGGGSIRPTLRFDGLTGKPATPNASAASTRGEGAMRPEGSVHRAKGEDRAANASRGAGRPNARDNAAQVAVQSDAAHGQSLSAVAAITNALGTLHRARFADTGLRWLFFLSGMLGTVMVGSGLFLWVSKRAAKHARAGRAPFSLRLVEALNAGGIAGLTVALAAFFWANRLIPTAVENRADREILAFFLVWLMAGLYPLARGIARAWPEELALSAVLFALLPMLNPMTGGLGLGSALAQGNWLIAGVDLALVLSGLTLGYAAWRTGRALGYRGAQKPSLPERRNRTGATDPIVGE